MVHHEAMRAIAWTQWVRVAGAVILLGAVAFPVTARADDKTGTDKFLGGSSFAVQSGTTFYAWANAGDTVGVDFVKADIDEDVEVDGVLDVVDPAGEQRAECVIEHDGKAEPCSFGDLSSSTAGIWRIDYRSAGDAKAIPAHWNITVSAEGENVAGRVWTDRYNVYQDPGAGARIDLYYLSQLGFQYKAVYRGYNGGWSSFEAGTAGLTHAGTCEPINHSPGGMKGDFDTDLAACGAYKVFFGEPAADLPESGKIAGGEATWLLTAVKEPALGAVEYRPAEPHSVAGDLLVTVTDHQGVITVELDLNGNGKFGDEADRSISVGVTEVGTGQIAVPWDGLTGEEKKVRNGRNFDVRATIDRVGTIYFVNSDVEGRSGGIEVEYLNGPDAGERTLYWDDAPDPTRENAADQSGKTDSLGGARSWDFGANSWGSDRRIQEWAFAGVDITTDTASFVTPPREPNDSAEVVAGAWWHGPFAWVAGIGVFTSIVGLGLLLYLSRRSSDRDVDDKSQLLGLP